MVILLAVLAASASEYSGTAAAGDGWLVRRVTTNEWYDVFVDLDPEGRYLVFQGEDGIGADREIFLYDIEVGSLLKLTDNALDDLAPRVDSGHVVWHRDDGRDTEVMLYEIATARTTLLTDNPTRDAYPEVCGDLVVWAGWTGAGADTSEIYAHHIRSGATTRLTDNLYEDAAPRTDGSWVVWQGRKGSDWDIVVWDGAVKTMVTINDRDDTSPMISNHELTWVGHDGTDHEVFLRRGGVVEQVTRNAQDEWTPQIYASAGKTWLAWTSGEPEHRDVFLAGPQPGAPKRLITTRLTADDLDDDYLAIGAQGLVWTKHGVAEPGFDYTVYHSTLGGALSVVEEGWARTAPSIGGSYVAFEAFPGSYSDPTEVFLATRDDEAPAVAITSPAHRDVLSGGSAIIRGTATDNFAVERVEVDTGDGVWHEAALESGAGTASATWRYDWTLPFERGVDHTLRARVTDGAGNSALSAAHVTVRVTNVAEKRTFRDVPVSHPYYDAVMGMQQAQVIEGYPVGQSWEFRPANHLWRAQFAKMVCAALGLAADESMSSPFTDLGADAPDDLYPHEYVAVAYEEGITAGTSATTFAPYADVTRTQTVTMLVRATQNLHPGELDMPPAGYAGTLGDFDPTHGPTLKIAEYNGLLEGLLGFGPGWSPWGPATRGETAQLIWNLMGELGTRP